MRDVLGRRRLQPDCLPDTRTRRIPNATAVNCLLARWHGGFVGIRWVENKDEELVLTLGS